MGAFALALAGCDDGASDTGQASGSGSGGETEGVTTDGTGGETAETGQDTGADDWNCGMHVLQNLTDDCEGIGSAQDLIDASSRAQASDLQWSDYVSEDISHVPAAGTSNISLQLKYDGGEARCFHDCDPCPGLPCGAAAQPARIEVDALLDVSTDDGALAVQDWDAVVEGMGGGAGYASFSATATPSELDGTLVIDVINPAYESPEIGLSGQVTPDFVSGSLTIWASQPGPNAPSISVPLANWPVP
jgi:hypothetical protein